ncbi:MAG: GNAT family N-acetyltransferase [Candidatus Omnitrophica bacterium]|nr:GNAT family N-acetyltransferase [Candidatus Omnitrophota bacterium]
MDPENNIKSWKGSYEIYQNAGFAGIVAKHYKLEVINSGGLIVLLRRIPIMGYTKGILGSPEVFGNSSLWWQKIESLDFGYLDIHTSQELNFLDAYRTTPEDNFSMILDLSLGGEALFARCTSKCRTAIRKGEKNKIVIRESGDENDLKRFYQIAVKASDGGRKFDLQPYGLMADLMRSSYGRLILAQSEGRLIGGQFNVVSHNIHGWVHVIDRDFLHLSPGNLMIFETAKWGITNGCRFYSLGDQSLSRRRENTRFKMSFNPLVKPAYTYCVPKSKIKILLIDGKRYLSRLINRKAQYENKFADEK